MSETEEITKLRDKYQAKADIEGIQVDLREVER